MRWSTLLFLTSLTIFLAPTVLSLAARKPQDIQLVVSDPHTTLHHPQKAFTLWCSPDNAKVTIKKAYFLNKKTKKRFDATVKGNNATYTFTSPTLNDSGEYFCKLNTTNGLIQSQIHVYVSPVAVSKDEHFNTVNNIEVTAPTFHVVNGSEVNMTCPVFAYPAPTIIWKKDKQAIEMSGNVIVDGSTIRIKEVNDDLVGHYSCEAQNEYSVNGQITKPLLVIRRELTLKSEIAWIWPLLVIIFILVSLVLIIFLCEIRKKRQNKQSRYTAQE